ncbi:uncharacterized protein LOC118203600, partial [Stegodyphus dumicola]|uniref:uncharacterized protein LOC118203600 n=1 Tax=Stegodyphus dumicola TaxID=202533 RepID=UPI0015B2B392
MPHMCPRSCSSLATAAVFVSVGVVQIFAGFIFLQSKYVYLLAAPDIWTAFSNFSVGAALGISSRIWKNLRKASAKHMLKRNLQAALMVSAIIINTTTITLLILGENNALLAIYLETNGRYHSVTLASELLAY